MNRHNLIATHKKTVAYMMANFDTSNLLTHGEVSTFFHEFGHIMQSICAKPNYSKLSSSGGERDFVELPSQMLENWTWDRDTLKRLSHHHETGE